MKALKLTSDGFSFLELCVGLFLLAAIFGAGSYVLDKQHADKKAEQAAEQPAAEVSNPDITWSFSEQQQKWITNGPPAPDCPDPLFANSPVDFSTVVTVLFPGQYRGYNYKPHGAFGISPGTAGQVEVKLPMDAKITGLTRYLEGSNNALQYLVTFVNDCGIEIKFDHLATLSPRLQAIAETRPAPLKDNTKSDPNNKPTPELFKGGEVIATAVGNPGIKMYGFDFGVADYRKPNDISKNEAWKAIHNTYTASEWYGVCWFDMLPGDDADTAKKMSETPTNPSRPNTVSDYCKNAPKNTLEVNGGKPTDG